MARGRWQANDPVARGRSPACKPRASRHNHPAVSLPENISHKAALRTKMRIVLKNPAPDTSPILAALRAWLDGIPASHTVAAYAALPGEIDVLGLIRPGRAWALPRVAGDDLVFHRVTDSSRDLVAGAFGIREPHPSLPVVPLSEIHVFLCPGLAFDHHGGRLGRGRGFYDRALENARPDAIKAGVCHAAQRVDDTFPEPHDIRMDLVFSGPA